MPSNSRENILQQCKIPGVFPLGLEAERHRKAWDYVRWAETLRGRPVLLIAVEDQKHADMEALAAAIRQKDSVTLEYREEETDHSFSDHRIALQTIVLEWLAELKKPAPSEKP